MRQYTRRNFLHLATVLGAFGCGGEAASGESSAPPMVSAPTPDPGGLEPTPPPPATPTVTGVDLDMLPLLKEAFPYGVMAGDATPTHALLWTRYVGKGALWVQIEAEGGPKGTAVISRAVAPAEQSEAGFVHVDAGVLTAGARYRYSFFVMEAGVAVGRGPLGFVRAALAAEALEVVTFAGASCTHQNGAPYPLLADAATRKVDFFLHGGDHVYCDAGVDAVTLDEYRAKYAQAWAASGMKALHGSTGMVMTWDDHEVANDWNPETFPKARFEAARRAFFEHRATRRDPANPNRLWRSFTWGNTLELLVLDVRSERKPSTASSPNAQFISPAQMAWLKERLEKSTAVFKLVLTSVPISDFPLSAKGESDKWEGYPAQRDDILDFVRDKAITGMWWLSGDLHFGCVGAVGTTPARMKMREILMGPAGTDARNPSLAAPQFERVIGEQNYTLFRADPVKRELTVEFIGAGGTIYERTYPA